MVSVKLSTEIVTVTIGSSFVDDVNEGGLDCLDMSMVLLIVSLVVATKRVTQSVSQ